MKSPTKAKSLPEGFKKSTGAAAASLFAAKRKVEDGSGRTESSSPSGTFEGSEVSLSNSKQKKRRSFGIKKSLPSNSIKKIASLEKSMRGHTLAVNNRSLANQVQALKTQLRIAQEENVDKSRQVNELTARVRRFEVIDDQERFELLLQERLKQELALLGDLVRETVVGLSRSAEKLNTVLTISQRMQSSHTDQGRTLLAPRPRILLTSPQERSNRLPTLFDQHETHSSSSFCGPTIRKKSLVPVEQRKINCLQEEMRIDEENEGESPDAEHSLPKPQQSPTATDPTPQLSIIDEGTEESPFAKKDKVPRTPLPKTPVQPNVWQTEVLPRRDSLSPPRPLRPMSPGLVQKLYKQPTDNDDLNTSVPVNDSDQVVAETPLSSRYSHESDETLTGSVANRSNASPAAAPDDILNESPFIRSRRRNISIDNDEESPDNKRALPSELPNEAKETSPAKRSRIDRRDTFVVTKPAVLVRPPLSESRQMPSLPSPLRSVLPLSPCSPQIGSGRQSARSSSADQEDTPKAFTSSPHAAPLIQRKSGTPPSTAAVNVASERNSPRFFKRPNVVGEQTTSAAVGQQAPVGIFDLSLLSTDDSPQLGVVPVVRKKASTKPKKKASKASRSKTPMVESPPAKVVKDKTLSAKNSNAGQHLVVDRERSETPSLAESNSTFTVPIERATRSRSRARTPAQPEDDDTNPGDRTTTSESADGEPGRARSRRNAALKVTSFKEASLNTKMRRNH